MTLMRSAAVSFALLAAVFVVIVGCGDLDKGGAAGGAVEPSPPPVSRAGAEVAGSTASPPEALPTVRPLANAVSTPSVEEGGQGAAGHDDGLERP